MPPTQKITPMGPLTLGLLLGLLSGSEFYQRASIALDGKVVSSETSCMQPANNRCATVYVVESKDGVHTEYIAGPTDHSLQRRLPVGTNISKQKWHLSYSINGTEIDTFPVVFHTYLLTFAGCCLYWAFSIYRVQRKT